MHLGLLALRLGLPLEAERAFRIASFPDLHATPCLTASMALASIYSEAIACVPGKRET